MTKYTLKDFRVQMQGARKQYESMAGMPMNHPGFDAKAHKAEWDHELRLIEGIVDSMTPMEREHPDWIDVSRRQRIARGSGNNESDVNELLKQFNTMSRVMQRIAEMGPDD